MPHIVDHRAYPGRVWIFLRPACVVLVVTLAVSGCTASPSTKNEATPPVTASAGTVQPSRTPSPTPTPAKVTASPRPTTAKPAPSKAPAAVPKLNATASISIASVDRNTGELVVGGYVTGVFEDGGDCAFGVTSSTDSTPVVLHTIGVANVDATSCGSTSIPKDQLNAGTYTVTLTYTNGAGTTSSSSISVKVAS